MKTNRRVILPKPINDEGEQLLQKLKKTVLEETNKYKFEAYKHKDTRLYFSWERVLSAILGVYSRKNPPFGVKAYFCSSDLSSYFPWYS